MSRTPCRAGCFLLPLLLGTVVPQPQGSVEGSIFALDVRLTGAVVYLLAERVTAFPPPAPALIDQVNLRFVPPVLTVLPGTSVEFRNSDPLLHNVFGAGHPGDAFDLGTYPRGKRRVHTFTRPGPHVILCHVHPEMAAYVVVVPTPYAAVADREGRFLIPDVPRGRYTLRVWHRRTRPYERLVTVAPGERVHLELELMAVSSRRAVPPPGGGAL